MPDQNAAQPMNASPAPEAALETQRSTASDTEAKPLQTGPGGSASNAHAPLMQPVAKAAAVSALSGDDKKTFVEKILAQTEKLAEAVVQNPPAYGADGHLIKDESAKQAAMSALEGDKWHERRLEEEAREKLERRRQELLAEKEATKLEIDKLEREKEVFELQWVNLNDQKTPLNTELSSIIAEETKLEADEKKKEQEEVAAEKPEDRKVIEDERWKIQQDRRGVEEKKWAVQDKVSTINEAMLALSAKYQEILAQEDVKKRRVQGIDSDIKNL